jgi:GNAT superfamily N-acetyltransferase
VYLSGSPQRAIVTRLMVLCFSFNRVRFLSVSIRAVRTRREIRRFVDVPWRLGFRKHVGWVPPLRIAVQDSLDTRRNPFYRYADLALWTAHRNNRVVGRIAAIENRAHNRTHGDKIGFFGFFECVDDQETAEALFATASRWLSQRGLDRMRGPVNPSMNHECGLLVESFDDPPKVMTPWNPPYYASLLESYGFGGVKDLLSFWIPATRGLTPLASHEKILRRLRRRGRVTCRPFDFGRFEEDLKTMRTLFNEAWSGTWGFVPLTEEDFGHMAKTFRFVAIRDLTLFAEVDGEPAAFLLVLPDLNQVFRSIPSGRLSPWALWKLLRAPKTVLENRVVLLGTREQYRNRGLFSFLVQELHDRAIVAEKSGAEGSWILEDNEALTKPLGVLGPPTRRWRMYEKSVAQKAEGPPRGGDVTG